MGKTNTKAKMEIVQIHGNRCMLTNINIDKNKTYQLTYHHILKKKWGGQATVENGANLIHEIHNWVHTLEHYDKELFNLVNECLLLYKECERLDNMELVQQFEDECQPLFKEKVLTYGVTKSKKRRRR